MKLGGCESSTIKGLFFNNKNMTLKVLTKKITTDEQIIRALVNLSSMSRTLSNSIYRIITPQKKGSTKSVASDRDYVVVDDMLFNMYISNEYRDYVKMKDMEKEINDYYTYSLSFLNKEEAKREEKRLSLVSVITSDSRYEYYKGKKEREQITRLEYGEDYEAMDKVINSGMVVKPATMDYYVFKKYFCG